MNILGMNATDMAVFAIVLVSALYALARGAVREVLSIAAWLGAGFVAIEYYGDAAPLVARYVSPDWLAAAATVILLFFGTLVLLAILTRWISTKVREGGGALDRTLGFLFGVARGVLIASLFYLGISFVVRPADQPSWMQEARVLPILRWTGRTIAAAMPGSVEEYVKGALVSGADSLDRLDLLLDGARGAERLALPTRNPDSDDDSGYNTRQRRQMDRLIETLP